MGQQLGMVVDGLDQNRGRKSRYSGKRLFYNLKPIWGSIVNPRRHGSHGWSSMNIIMAAGKDGVTYEEYVEAGGRPRDLRWDIDRGYVRVE